MSLCLIKYHAMWMYEELEVLLHAFLISALVGQLRATAALPSEK